jgi:hypothetical protein
MCGLLVVVVIYMVIKVVNAVTRVRSVDAHRQLFAVGQLMNYKLVDLLCLDS